MSRMQPWYAAAYFLKKPLPVQKKKAAAILTAGGKENEYSAEHHIRALFRMLNADGFEDHYAISRHTDTIPAREDKKAVRQTEDMTAWLNEEPYEEAPGTSHDVPGASLSTNPVRASGAERGLIVL